jgi:hypothetical protein
MCPRARAGPEGSRVTPASAAGVELSVQLGGHDAYGSGRTKYALVPTRVRHSQVEG